MRLPATSDVTRLLSAWGAGDICARDQLIPLVYGELRRLAHARMRLENPGGMFQTTALVNEAYLRLVAGQKVSWQNRAHFFAVCAQAMRRILVDAARARQSLKRGGNGGRIVFDEALALPAERDRDLVALDDALTEFSRIEPRKSQVVELRYFGGLGVQETAHVLGVSPQTVMRDWKFSRLWLLRALRQAGDSPRGRQ